MKEQRIDYEYSLAFREPRSILNFVDNTLPPQKKDTKDLEIYKNLSAIPLIPLVINFPKTNELLFVGISRPIRGSEIPYLAHFGAPNKSFGHDTNDYISDEKTLFNPDSTYSANLLANHQQIPNWNIFERIRERLTRTIKQDYEKPDPSNPGLSAVIQLRKKDGQLSVDLDLHPYVEGYLKDSMFDIKPAPIETYLPELGPLVLGAYSPEITSKWPEEDSYSKKCADKGTRQRIAATQFVAYSISRAGELVPGRFATNFAHYCETGRLLPAPTEEMQIFDAQKDLKNTQLPFPEEPYFDADSVGPIW